MRKLASFQRHRLLPVGWAHVSLLWLSIGKYCFGYQLKPELSVDSTPQNLLIQSSSVLWDDYIIVIFEASVHNWI